MGQQENKGDVIEMKNAILESIRKWEKIVLMEGVDEGYDNCALCIECDRLEDESEDYEKFSCDFCPLDYHCDEINSPYQIWVDSFTDAFEFPRGNNGESYFTQCAAENMLDAICETYRSYV